MRLCGIAFDHLGPSRVRLRLHVASVRLSDAGRLDLGAVDAGAGPPVTR